MICGRSSSRKKTTWRGSWLRSGGCRLSLSCWLWVECLNPSECKLHLSLMSNKNKLNLGLLVFTFFSEKCYFILQVRDKLNLKVNSISAPEESCSKRAPSRNIESIRWQKLHFAWDVNQHKLYPFVYVCCGYVIGYFWVAITLCFIHFWYYSVDVLVSLPTYVRCLTLQTRWWVTSVSSTRCMMSPWATNKLKPWSERYVPLSRWFRFLEHNNGDLGN